MGMTGNQYRDLIAGYIYRSYAPFGLLVYTEISLGKTIIGKDRKIDVFVVRSSDQRAIALECKYQDSQGTTDEKIPYALEDLAALWLPGCSSTRARAGREEFFTRWKHLGSRRDVSQIRTRCCIRRRLASSITCSQQRLDCGSSCCPRRVASCRRDRGRRLSYRASEHRPT
jgi:hypothetical protein